MPDALARWTQSPDDPTLGGDVVAYELARGPGPNATAVVATVAATAAAGDTEAVDAPGPGTWFYRVRAVSAAGRRSTWSNEASVTVSPLVPHAVVVRLLAAPGVRGRLRAAPGVTVSLRAAPRITATLTAP